MKKLKLSLIVVIALLIILILSTIVLNQTGVIKRVTDNINKEEVKKEISYEVYKHLDGKTAMLVIVEDTENGIEKVIYPDNEMELSCNGKTKVAFDYNTDITGKESLTFKAINTLGEEIEKKILINDQFYLSLINHSIVDETGTQKVLTVDYKEGSITKQYKIGESNNWTNYTNTIRLDDYQILETLGDENREKNIYLRQIDNMGYEIVTKVKYNIDESINYKQEDTVIEGESILACVENNTLASGNYIFKVTGTTDGKITETIEYPVELYNYNEDATYIGQNYTVIGNTAYIGMGKANQEKRMLILKYNGNLTINEGVTITPTGTNASINGATYLCTKKGMFIYCAGTLTNNGSISMTAKGTVNQAGENVYLYKNADNTYEYIPAVGANGGASVYRQWPNYANGNSGINGNDRKTGGGASGGTMASNGAATSGAGGIGTSYSGGAGGGAVNKSSSPHVKAESGSNTGGKGGNGIESSGIYKWGVGAGAGNPGGTSNSSGNRGETGTGGLFVINSRIIVNNGTITSNGSNGGYGSQAGGGGSGGGSINLFYKETIRRGNINTNGGSGGGGYVRGGAGGAGSITIGNISTGTFVRDE